MLLLLLAWAHFAITKNKAVRRRMWLWAARAMATTAWRGCWTTATSQPRWMCWRLIAACGGRLTSKRVPRVACTGLA